MKLLLLFGDRSNLSEIQIELDENIAKNTIFAISKEVNALTPKEYDTSIHFRAMTHEIANGSGVLEAFLKTVNLVEVTILLEDGASVKNCSSPERSIISQYIRLVNYINGGGDIDFFVSVFHSLGLNMAASIYIAENAIPLGDMSHGEHLRLVARKDFSLPDWLDNYITWDKIANDCLCDLGKAPYKMLNLKPMTDALISKSHYKYAEVLNSKNVCFYCDKCGAECVIILTEYKTDHGNDFYCENCGNVFGADYFE